MSTAPDNNGLPPLPDMSQDTPNSPAPNPQMGQPAIAASPGLPEIKDEELLDFEKPKQGTDDNNRFRMILAGIVLVNVVIVAVVGFLLLNNQTPYELVDTKVIPNSFNNATGTPTVTLTPTATVTAEPRDPAILTGLTNRYDEPDSHSGAKVSILYPEDLKLFEDINFLNNETISQTGFYQPSPIDLSVPKTEDTVTLFTYINFYYSEDTDLLSAVTDISNCAEAPLEELTPDAVEANVYKFEMTTCTEIGTQNDLPGLHADYSYFLTLGDNRVLKAGAYEVNHERAVVQFREIAEAITILAE